MTNKAPGRRSSVEASRTRDRILRLAEKLFARKGYQGVSLRELADRTGVRMFTVQHHFGSKLRLYHEVVARFERDVEEVLRRIVAEEDRPGRLVERIVDELFDFLLAHRDWVALNARAVLGEGIPGRNSFADQGWVAFMSSTMRERNIGPGLDVRLLLITVEGILNNHALAVSHYQRLFGRDVTDPALATRTKAHLKRVILAILGEDRTDSRRPR